MASKQPQRTHLVLYLKLEALITLVSMCILPFIAILVASEAIMASEVTDGLRFKLIDINNLC